MIDVDRIDRALAVTQRRGGLVFYLLPPGPRSWLDREPADPPGRWMCVFCDASFFHGEPQVNTDIRMQSERHTTIYGVGETPGAALESFFAKLAGAAKQEADRARKYSQERNSDLETILAAVGTLP